MNIVLIGSGNVAWHLGKRLHQVGARVVQIVGRNIENTQRLAGAMQTSFVTDITLVDKKADLYILAVNDNAIESVAQSIASVVSDENCLVVHTSGATPSSVLAAYFKKYGSFYPLQSFSINRPVDFETIPVCLYSSDNQSYMILKKLAYQIAKNVYIIDDRQRAVLHVAAVFVNNFTNYLFHVSEKIVQKEQIAFDLLKPLMNETLAKIQNSNAFDMQTGPAKRKDIATIDRHSQFLHENYPEYEDIYLLLTQKIMMTYNDK